MQARQMQFEVGMARVQHELNKDFYSHKGEVDNTYAAQAHERTKDQYSHKAAVDTQSARDAAATALDKEEKWRALPPSKSEQYQMRAEGRKAKREQEMHESEMATQVAVNKSKVKQSKNITKREKLRSKRERLKDKREDKDREFNQVMAEKMLTQFASPVTSPEPSPVLSDRQFNPQPQPQQ